MWSRTSTWNFALDKDGAKPAASPLHARSAPKAGGFVEENAADCRGPSNKWYILDSKDARVEVIEEKTIFF